MKPTTYIAICMAATMAPGAAAGQEVRLRPKARISAEQIRLADVADVRGLGIPAREAVVLCLSPDRTAGEVTLADVRSALRKAGVNTVPICFAGASRCAVRRRLPPEAGVPARVPPETAPRGAAPPPAAEPAGLRRTIGWRIRRQAADQLGVEIDGVVVTFKRANAEVAGERPESVIGLTSRDTHGLGRRRWRVIYVKDGRKRHHYLSGEVSLRRAVVVATRSLAARQEIGPDDVKKVVCSDAGADDLMTDLVAVVGQRTTRRIRAGRPIAAKDLTAPLLVRRGQETRVTCGVVRISAKALSKGKAGDLVQFENLDSGKRFWAVVAGPGRARLRLAPAG